MYNLEEDEDTNATSETSPDHVEESELAMLRKALEASAVEKWWPVSSLNIPLSYSSGTPPVPFPEPPQNYTSAGMLREELARRTARLAEVDARSMYM